MESVSCASTTSTSADDTLFAAADPILVELVQLPLELYTSREMWRDLVDSLADLHAKFFRKDSATNATNALVEYITLLRSIQSFLETHLRSSKIARLANHWAMKKRIKDFHVQRMRIQVLLQLKVLDSAEQQTERVESSAGMIQRIERQHKEDLKTLQRMISDICTTTVRRVGDAARTVVALADLKHEIKSTAAEYSESDIAMMKQLFLAGCKSYKIPRASLSLPSWYIAHSNVRFTGTDPFATGAFQSLHYGTVDSGSRVAVHMVNAAPEDTMVRELFVREVTTLNQLRDPHILPFYGANHIGTPLMCVTAHASHGNYRSFLGSHRDRFWQLFLDAARGLSYLHKNKVVHGNLKCTNLLVLADGTGVVSDFMFAFVRACSELSFKAKPTTLDWTAPECLGVGEDAAPRFESDSYSLGLCMIEAKTGRRPFKGVTESDEGTRDRIRCGQLPDWASRGEIPPNVVLLVAKMCAFEPSKRAKLSEIIRILEVLAAQESVVGEASPSCRIPVDPQQTEVEEEPGWELL